MKYTGVCIDLILRENNDLRTEEGVITKTGCHNSLTCRLDKREMAVTVKPKEQKARRTVLPKASRITPASTDARGIIPCEPMPVRLLTLLSLSLSTIRMIAVVTGMLIQEIKNPTIAQPRLNATRNALIRAPRSTKAA